MPTDVRLDTISIKKTRLSSCHTHYFHRVDLVQKNVKFQNCWKPRPPPSIIHYHALREGAGELSFTQTAPKKIFPDIVPPYPPHGRQWKRKPHVSKLKFVANGNLSLSHRAGGAKMWHSKLFAFSDSIDPEPSHRCCLFRKFM